MFTNAGTFGGLIPIWILGAPLLFALFNMMTLPRSPRTRHDAQRP